MLLPTESSSQQSALKLNMTLSSDTIMLGIESRTLSVVGKHPELHPQPICMFKILLTFETGSHVGRLVSSSQSFYLTVLK